MQLIPNWKQAFRMFSVQAMTLATAIQGAWMAVPDDMKSGVPPKLMPVICMVLLGAGILGRLVAQPAVSLTPDVKTPETPDRSVSL